MMRKRARPAQKRRVRRHQRSGGARLRRLPAQGDEPAGLGVRPSFELAPLLRALGTRTDAV